MKKSTIVLIGLFLLFVILKESCATQTVFDFSSETYSSRGPLNYVNQHDEDGLIVRAAALKLDFDILTELDSLKAAFMPDSWVVTYDRESYDDSASAIAVDVLGNVYVTGASTGANTGSDFATIKYDPGGNEQWVSRYNWRWDNAESARAIAVDNSGNVYVTGYVYGGFLNPDYCTVKYDSSGNEIWVETYSWLLDAVDYPSAIAVDGSGNVYVTGSGEGILSGFDYVTIKYDTNGTREWIARYDGPGNTLDFADALAVDGSGNVYISGESHGSGTDYDYATVKYDTNGNELWVARYDGPVNSKDSLSDMVIDNDGNIIVTGQSIGLSGYDYATVKYDTYGNELWVARYNGPAGGSDAGRGVALDSAGNIYVTGTSSGLTGLNDFATIKYDANGNQLWVARYDRLGSFIFNDYAWEIGVDSEANVYVTGTSGFYDSPDIVTVKYDTNGNEQWVAIYSASEVSYDYVRALAVDNSDNIYVTGYTDGFGTGKDYVTIKYTDCVSPIRIQGVPPVYFHSFQNAYENTLTNDTIQTLAYAFYEDAVLDKNVFVYLEAGHSCSYTVDSLTTTLAGNMTITDGTLTISSGTLVVQ